MNLMNKINPFALARRINRPLILDGAMGSLLQQRGIKSKGPLWMSLANIDHSESVRQVHENYIEAGADIITTNTFRTNPIAVEAYGNFNSESLVKKSVQLAVEAAKDLPVFVAGSNAPAEDCYQQARTIQVNKLQYNHHKHISLLMENGAHFILNETQSHLDEIKIIGIYCSRNDIPFVISLFVDENLHLLSGENLISAVNVIKDFNPLAIGINCVRPKTFEKFYIKEKLAFNWGIYLNCGSGNFTDENIACGINPDEYGIQIKKYLSKSPSYIGACCGSSPEHIKKIKLILDD